MTTNILTFTPEAESRIKQILAKEAEKIGIVFSVKTGGCAGMEYDIALVAKPPEEVDHFFINDINVFIPKSSLLFLLGTKIGYETTPIRTGFVFHNPNQLSACGCGESVMLKPAAPIKG